MDFFVTWALFVFVQLVATMSPGPAFAVFVRSALSYGRRVGFFTALGLGGGVAVHVVFVLCGLSVVISQSVFLFDLMKYAGGVYLVFIGVRAMIAQMVQGDGQNGYELDHIAVNSRIHVFKAFQIGFMTNLLNPKAVVFFTAVFTQFVEPGSSLGVMVLYGGSSVLVEVFWFSLLAFVLTMAWVKARFLRVSHLVERACGGLLIMLGVRLVLSKAH